MKRLTAWILCLLLFLPPVVTAETWEEYKWAAYEDDDMEAWNSLAYWLDEAPGFGNASNATWKTIGAKKAANLPVYAAPFDNAWRGAKGKAAVATGEGFRLLGSAQDGRWLMVEYSLDRKNNRRVGWIRTPDGTNGDDLFEYSWEPRRLLCRVNRKTLFTDDPRGNLRKVRDLEAGEEVIAMFVLGSKGGWYVYVETAVEGKLAWGFVQLDALDCVPLHTLEGNRILVREGVTCIGETGEWWYDPETEEGGRNGETIRPGDIWCPGISLWDQYAMNAVDEIVLPSTLRSFGGEGIVHGDVGVLRLRGNLTRASDYGLYGVSVGRMMIAADYAGEVVGGEYSTVEAYEVEAGNPRYASADGVLFSADRKTLLRYPNGSTDKHYNVPAGTETVAARAFTDDGGGLPLTSLSLPIGLKKIGAYAFTGCTRLLSLTVPLTVTELDPTAFAECVSLERLSLPPGLTAEFNRSWAQQGDFTYYNGDNGSTAPDKDGTKQANEWEEWDAHSVSVRLFNPDGEGPVPGYRTADGEIPVIMLSTGYCTSFSKAENGRAHLYIYDEDYEDVWVDLTMMQPYVYNAFFTVVDAVPNEKGFAADVWHGHDPRGARFTDVYYSRSDQIEFSFPSEDWEYAAVPADLTTLYRDDDGTGRRMGILCDSSAAFDYATNVVPVLRLFDAPDGFPAGLAFAGDHAILLEERDGWFHVKTLRAEGWLPAERVAEVVVRDAE